VHGEVDSAQRDRAPCAEAPAEEPIAAAEVHDDGTGREVRDARDRAHRDGQAVRETALEPAPARFDRGRGIAGGARPAVLRLQQVPVALTRAVERVAARTAQGGALPGLGSALSADWCSRRKVVRVPSGLPEFETGPGRVDVGVATDAGGAAVLEVARSAACST